MGRIATEKIKDFIKVMDVALTRRKGSICGNWLCPACINPFAMATA